MNELEEGSISFDKFLISKKLGEGAYGRVYKALDLSDRTEVALKISVGDGPEREQNILEAEILEAIHSVDSPQTNLVVNLKDSYILENCMILVLDLMSHNFLKTITRGKTLNNLGEVSRYAKQMLEFLQFMSEIGVIHGDIKPENILVDDKTNKIKFSDFGLAHCPWSTHMNTYVQTLSYMAPEVLLGFNYDASIDIWSVGCVLVEAFTGIQMFQVKDEYELMRSMARLIGTPNDIVISQSSKRDKYFHYDEVYQQWIVRGLGFPVAPMGLKEYLRNLLGSEVLKSFNEVDLTIFIDFIESMLRLNPRTRYTPDECLKHPFITRPRAQSKHERSSKDSYNSSGEELSWFSKQLNINSIITEKALKVFKRIRDEKLVRRQDTQTVKMCCLYIECQKIRVRKTFEQFSEVSGTSEGAIRRVWRVVKQAADKMRIDEHLSY